ncbi:VOC family protein [Burkholderia multivorans]|uniref:VOC family protein n=1 Tax=Burkholderia multivorans TaxID=87883 RepID=UPI0020A1FABB|nr:VOC family protein [Burkholderia multivorans]MCO8589241.1 VOC family protein [Burkholderia multivorans]MCO8633305.1 VOC family protein [Burkholderia multivorans]MCO8647106.1 VOC family protein [Burkholderia multivorans]
MTTATSKRTPFGIHSIDHFALDVPSLADARRFLTAFGLDVEVHERELRLRTAAGGHVWAIVRERARKRLAYLALNCFADDFEPLRKQIVDGGGRPARPDPSAPDDGFWFEDPDGNLLQLKPGAKTSPTCKPAPPPRSGVRPVRGASFRADAPVVHPARLSHVLMFTPDIGRAVAFYERALGLALSDGAAGIVAFLHARHGSDHHLMAFAQGNAKGWHHSAWDVPTVDDVGLGKMQMQHAGYAQGWGVGRHVLGSNYFHYVRDPWGSFWEYSADIDYVGAGVEWPSGDHRPEDSLYLWGPDVPDYFFENTEAS